MIKSYEDWTLLIDSGIKSWLLYISIAFEIIIISLSLLILLFLEFVNYLMFLLNFIFEFAWQIVLGLSVLFIYHTNRYLRQLENKENLKLSFWEVNLFGVILFGLYELFNLLFVTIGKILAYLFTNIVTLMKNTPILDFMFGILFEPHYKSDKTGIGWGLFYLNNADEEVKNEEIRGDTIQFVDDDDGHSTIDVLENLIVGIKYGLITTYLLTSFYQLLNYGFQLLI